MPGRQSRQGSGGERRAALVRAAFDRIAEAGFEGLRLRDVAAEAGIDHSTLHHYFPTKQDLIAGVVDHTTRQFWSTMPERAAAAEQLRAHLGTLSDLIRERPALFVVLRELDLRATRDPVVRAVMTHHDDGWRAALTAVFARGAAEGAWSAPIDPAAAATLVMAAVRGTNLDADGAPATLRQLWELLARQDRSAEARPDSPDPTAPDRGARGA